MNIQGSALLRETFPVGPLQCNCTIIGDPITKKPSLSIRAAILT